MIDRSDAIDIYRECCRCGKFVFGRRAGCGLLDKPCELKRMIANGELPERCENEHNKAIINELKQE